MIDPAARKKVIAKGLPASTGAVTGQVVFSSDEAETLAAEGQKVILVRKETTPEDIHGMKTAEGILTSLGGMTSHAAAGYLRNPHHLLFHYTPIKKRH